MKYFIILIILVSLGLDAKAQPDTHFTEGNKALAARQYSDAITAYTAINSSESTSVGLHKNIALAYIGLKDFPLAILHYEKALKLSPNNSDIISDLKITKSQISTLDESPSDHWIVRLFRSITGLCGERIWALGSLFIMAMIGWILVWYCHKKSVPLFKYIGILSVFLLCFVISAAYRSHQMYSANAMIITQDGVQLKTGPDQASPDVEAISPGSKVYLSDSLGGWIQVKTENGEIGWIMYTQGQKI